MGQEVDALLARGDAQSLARVVARVQEAPALVTPMTLMVLAIRLYDAGQRDDAVFWFYAAKDRFLTAAQVLDFADARLAQVQDAVRNFAALAGPYFNSYAFCDLQKQQAIRARAVDWVAAHPYEVVFRDDLPALPGNRRANLKAAVDQMRSEAASEAGKLQDGDFVANFQRQREQNGVDAQFCWQ